MLSFLKSQFRKLRGELFAEPSKRGIEGVLALDGLRGLAVLFVFLEHAHAANLCLVEGLKALTNGKRGVWIFFALSAYLLSYSFFAKGDRALKPAALGKYFLRRFLRIYPLYIAVLLVSFLVTAAAHSRTGLGLPFVILSGESLLRHALLLEGRDVMWSIGVEFKYYLVIPFFAALFLFTRRQGMIFSTALFVGLLAFSALLWPTSEMAVNDRSLGPYLPVFFAGSFFAYLSARYDQAGIADAWPRLNRALHWTGCALALSALLAIPGLYRFVPGARAWDALLSSELVYSGLFCAVIIFAFTKSRSWVTRIFSFPFLRSLGIVCFSFYLLHPMMITIVGISKRFVPIPNPVDLLLAFALTYVAAGFSYVYIEKPFLSGRLALPAWAPGMKKRRAKAALAES